MAPTVHVPSAEADRPSWLRVGLVAVVGFAIGVAWPKIAGVRLGPSAPAEALSAVAAATRAAEVTSASASIVTPAPPPSASAAPPPTVLVTVSHGSILSCRDEDGDPMKGKQCGWLAGLDPLIQTRLKRLAQAPVAADNPGKLSVVLALDFKNNRISVEGGRSSTVKDIDSLKAFIAGEVKSMSLKSVDHDHVKYSVHYQVTLGSAAPAGEASADATAPPSATASADAPKHETTTESLPDGMAAVGWEVAIVRDAPHTGAIVAHLPRGTKVQLGTSEGGWYRIKYGPDFSSEGFVYRGAIGK